MTGYRHLQVSELGPGVVGVRMMRADRRNSLTLEVLEELSVAFDEVVEQGWRVAVLSGDGPSFCAGADLYEVHNPNLAERNQVGLGAARLWEQLGELPIPVIAAVQGHAITGGLHLALCCDLIVADEDAVFQDTHAKLGLVPGSGEPQRTSRRIGIGAARELMLTSRRFSAAEARELGLVSRLSAPGQSGALALELATEIAANSPSAVGAIKRMLNGGWGMAYAEAQWSDLQFNWNGRLNQKPDDDARERLRTFRERARTTAEDSR